MARTSPTLLLIWLCASCTSGDADDTSSGGTSDGADTSGAADDATTEGVAAVPTDAAAMTAWLADDGYAGWSAGQLDGELARDDWLVVRADPYDVLGTDPERVWAKVMRRQRDLTRLWATLPNTVGAN